MAFTLDKDELIKELMAHPRIAKRVEELKLTREQVEQALPIMIDMADEEDDSNKRYLISFDLTPQGNIARKQVLSTEGLKYAYLSNVVTYDINPINFEEDKEFDKDIERKNLMPMIQKYLDKDSKYQKGIYLYGQKGVGKTFILKRIARMLAKDNKKVGFFMISDLVSQIKNSFKDDEGSAPLIRMLKEVDYLFIDDIGTEPITPWFRDENLFSILNDRMQNEKTTFFSSNFSYEELEKVEARTTGFAFKEFDKASRLMDRVKALTIPFELKGKNKRF